MGIGWTRPRMASCTRTACAPSSARGTAHAALGGGAARGAAGANDAGGAARGAAGGVTVVTGELIEDAIGVTLRDGKGGGVADGIARAARSRARVAKKEKEAKTRRVLKVQPREEQRAQPQLPQGRLRLRPRQLL